MEPGVHDITIEQYHGGAGISRSGIWEFRRSPLHYWYNYLSGQKPVDEKNEITTARDALGFGNAFHTYVLEPEEFEKRYFLLDKVNRATNIGKAAFAEAKLAAGNREILCRDAFTQILAMSAGIDRSTTARGLIEGGLYEKSLFWIDKDTGILCKVRPDIWHSNMIGDIKTCADASIGEFQRSVYRYGYHVQAAMIHEALYSLYGINMTNFIYIPVEKDAPHAVATYKLDDAALQQGIDIFKKTLFELKACMDSDSWTAYPDATISLPVYANKSE